MSKKYNIEKRSDMQRFHRDMMKKIEGIVEEKANQFVKKTVHKILSSTVR